MEIVFTTSQLITACAGIITISGAISVIVSVIAKAQAPNKLQDSRIENLENKVEKFEELLAKDKERFDDIESGNRVTQRAILALLAHGIDGNEIDGMRSAKHDLERYLIER